MDAVRLHNPTAIVRICGVRYFGTRPHSAARNRPGEILRHASPLDLEPRRCVTVERQGISNAGGQSVRLLASSKTKPLAVPAWRLSGRRINHRIGQTADPPHQRQGAVAQGIKLGQTTGLETRGNEQNVGTGDDAVRQGFIVAELDAIRCAG
jgi:hypothetical protein